MSLPPDLLRDLDPLCRAAGAFIRTEAQNFRRDKIEHKGFNDLVSYVDKGAEEILLKGCREMFPEAQFVGEESGSHGSDAEYQWIVDPLDGTTNFVHGIPAYCVSAALARGEEVLIGCIYDIPNDAMYTAEKGAGARLNGELIRVSGAEKLSQALIGTGFPYDISGMDDDYLAVLRTFRGASHGVRRFGSAALDLAWIAAGILDGFYEIGLNSWDCAAGILLVQEAGGVLSDFSGGDNYLFGKQIVAATPSVHPAMLEIISRLVR